MPTASKMKGKIIIDGLCSKFGKGISSVASIGFVSIAGSVAGSYPMTAVFALSICMSLIASTSKLGEELEKQPLPI
jgi:ATP/ADP translocase